MELYADGRRFYSADQYMKEKFGCRVYRLALDAGCTCPNRDGKISFGGCSFCSAGGSGDFAESGSDVTEQIEAAKQRVSGKGAQKYIAYFQSFTNTYGDTSRLENLFCQAASVPDIVCIDIATRPDCLEDDKLQMLKRLNKIKPVWVELGLQTIHEETAKSFGRGYSLAIYEDAVKRLSEAGIEVITHIILGLPGESHEDMLDTVKFVGNQYPMVKGVKLSMLHILKGTRLGDEYINKPFHTFTKEEYTDLLIDCLEVIPREMAVHRITGDGPKNLLIEPQWSLNKKAVLNGISQRMAERNSVQGLNIEKQC